MRMRCPRWLVGLAAALCGALATPASATAPAACPAAEAIAPGVFLVPGSRDLPSPANAGQVVNRVFLIGSQGVVLIDPGPTPEAGEALRCTIGRVSALPIVAIIDTHPHPENVLAALVFPEVPIHATTSAAQAMARRCAACQERLAAQIGDERLAGLRPRLPDRLVTAQMTINLGGRQLELIPLGAAHSPGDLAVLDHSSGSLIGGDVVNVEELPDLHDGRVADWIAALRMLAALPGVTRIVPGRGRPASPQDLGSPLRYLDTLWSFARQRVEAPDGFVPPATLPIRLQSFAGDAGRHALNLQHALREAEELWWSHADNPPATPLASHHSEVRGTRSATKPASPDRSRPRADRLDELIIPTYANPRGSP